MSSLASSMPLFPRTSCLTPAGGFSLSCHGVRLIFGATFQTRSRCTRCWFTTWVRSHCDWCHSRGRNGPWPPGSRLTHTVDAWVAWIPVATGQMELIAYWIAEGIPSSSLKARPGLLALPFSIETHGELRLLLPEWFGVYYVNSSIDEGFPVLALRSVTLDERFADWVKVATTRMPLFGLPAKRPEDSSCPPAG